MENPKKAYRGVAGGFTEKAGKRLEEQVSKKHFNHSIQVESIENNVATLKIHKFKEGKSRPAKDYKATILVTKFWGNKISDFTDFKIKQVFLGKTIDNKQ